MWALLIVLATTSGGVAATTIYFPNQEKCQEAQKFIASAQTQSGFADLRVESGGAYEAAGQLSIGQNIFFSGTFLKSEGDKDCVREVSLRERSSMTTPDWIFHR